MTHPISDSGTAGTHPKADSFVDWFHINSRMISVGAVVVAGIAFGVWFVQRTAMNETISADKQLLTAKQSLNSGNIPLAEADLKKVVDKYPDKPSGTEAGLLLAQIKLGNGDYQGAVTELTLLSAKVSSGPNAASVRGLLGDAESQLGKPADAAADYIKAAGLATGPNQQDYWRAKAGLMLLDAGKTPDGRRVFEDLAAQHDNEAMATEARLRLGELTAGSKP